MRRNVKLYKVSVGPEPPNASRRATAETDENQFYVFEEGAFEKTKDKRTTRKFVRFIGQYYRSYENQQNIIGRICMDIREDARKTTR